jgi:hypothetical protein
LKNETIQSVLNNFNFEIRFTHIIIHHHNDDLIEIQLKDFEEKVWAKCLKEVSENIEIKIMKENITRLSDEADNLIDEIIRT